jgi:hypothetical protein
MKFIKPKHHAILDYAVVALLLASPSIIPFTQAVAVFTYVLAGIHFTLTISTDFPGGLIKIIPLEVHALIELFVSILLLASVFILSDVSNTDRYYYTTFSCAVFLTWVFTDYKASTSKSI